MCFVRDASEISKGIVDGMDLVFSGEIVDEYMDLGIISI